MTFTDLLKLTQKKHRREMGLCIVEGEKIIGELRDRLVAVFCRKGYAGLEGLNATILTESEFNKITNLDNAPGVLAVVKIPKSANGTAPFLVLDNVQDPGNVGTLLRTAAAFDFKTVYALNSADVWSQKVIRSAMGAQFHLNIFDLNVDEFVHLRGEKLAKSTLFVADFGGKSVENAIKTVKTDTKIANNNTSKTADIDTKSANPISKVADFGLVLGSEGRGVSPEIKTLGNEVVTIGMSGAVESLNVAVAGGIIMQKFYAR
jgi:TrmH family RNA methyltransferase